jgi:hypothetical protein
MVNFRCPVGWIKEHIEIRKSIVLHVTVRIFPEEVSM